MWLWAPLLACASTEPAPAAAAAAEGPRNPEPDLDAATVGATLEAAFARGVPEAPTIIATYRNLLLHGDERCPGGGVFEGGMSVMEPEGCANPSSGYQYQGVCGGFYLACSDTDDDGQPDRCSSDIMGDGWIRDRTGAMFVIGGHVSVGVSGTDAAAVVTEEMYGSWGYPASPMAWLTQDLSLGFVVEGTFSRGSLSPLTFQGGMSVGNLVASMEGLRLGGACGDAPEGTVGLRSDAGYWYDLTYDTSTCDTCGEVVFDGRIRLGRACADVSEALALHRDILASDVARAYAEAR
jgi:hypothetical protein